MTDSKEIKVKEKQGVTTPAEQTIPGLVFTAAVILDSTKYLRRSKPAAAWARMAARHTAPAC